MALNLKKIKDEAIATVNAAQTMLHRFPDLDVNNVKAEASTSLNPIPFLLDLLKTTAGYDQVITWVARIIASVLPAVEVTIKAKLLANIRNMFTCSFNPMIPNELLLNGLVFPLDQIDVMNILQYSPMKPEYKKKVTKKVAVQENGKTVEREYTSTAFDVSAMLNNLSSSYKTKTAGFCYYFGCEGMKPDDLEDAGDFNAFLWYIKNRAMWRTSWRGVKFLQAQVGDSSWATKENRNGRPTYIKQKPRKDEDRMYDGAGWDTAEENNAYLQKDKLGAGIITLEYREHYGGLTNAEGGQLLWDDGTPTHDTVPPSNVLHVLLGCAEPFNEKIVEQREELKLYQSIAEDWIAKIDSLKRDVDQLTVEITNLERIKKENKTDAGCKNNVANTIKKRTEERTAKKAQIVEYEGYLTKTNAKIANLKSTILADNLNYKPITSNYYFGHTLIEFNYDYISSLKLLDAKVVVAQLIDALSGCFSFDADLSFERRVVQEETKRMVKSIIESDEAEISDCFFTFTNEGYNDMLKKVELMQAGLYSDDRGNAIGGKVKDPAALLRDIDTITPGASQEQIQSVVESALFTATAEFADVEEKVETDFNLKTNVNIVENILSNLAYVIVSVILSPKLYLLMAVNLKVLGKETPLTSQEFIRTYKGLLKEIIRGVRDIILDSLFAQVRKLVEDLVIGEAVLLAKEQMDYYKMVLRQCTDCFRRKNNTLDFNVDNVTYADITEEEATSDTQANNC